jgi:hypothetical protein
MLADLCEALRQLRKALVRRLLARAENASGVSIFMRVAYRSFADEHTGQFGSNATNRWHRQMQNTASLS